MRKAVSTDFRERGGILEMRDGRRWLPVVASFSDDGSSADVRRSLEGGTICLPLDIAGRLTLPDGRKTQPGAWHH